MGTYLSFPIIFNHAQHYQGNLKKKKKKQGSPCNFSPPKRLGEKKNKNPRDGVRWTRQTKSVCGACKCFQRRRYFSSLSYSFCLLIFFITSEILSPSIIIIIIHFVASAPLQKAPAPNPRSLHFPRPFHFHFNSLHSPPLTLRSNNPIFSYSNRNLVRASSLHPWENGFDCISVSVFMLLFSIFSC